MNPQSSEATKTCTHCGKVMPGTNGSITQWISGCKCAELSALESNRSEDQFRTSNCATCGKKIESGRPGSLTQWVFRKDLCSCFLGEDKTRTELQDPFEKEPATAGKGAHLESEIAVDATRFPLQRYAPLAILGKGAGGTVYLARDRILQQKVAIKCLNNLTPEQLLAFQMEAKATAKLNHPNIVKVINLDVTDAGAPYMVMEYFPSVSLAELIDESGGLAWQELYGVLSQIVDGLAYAHRNEVFHRDIKPTNILLQQSGTTPTIRIIDFGVALVKSMSDTTSQGRTLVGTPEYMSPDQAAGIVFDARSEIYSLGCLAFEAATGVPPFHGASALDLINQHAQAPPPSLDDFAESEFPPQLVDLIARLLEKDPNNRPQNMEELGKLLNVIAQSQTGISAYESQTENAGYEGGSSARGRWKVGKLQVIGVGIFALVGSILLYPHIQNDKAAKVKTDSAKREEIAAILKKFKVDLVEFDEPGKSKLMVTQSSPEDQVTDEDLQYIGQVMGQMCDSIDLSSFTGVKGEGIKYLRKFKIKCINAPGMSLTPAGWKYLSEIKSLHEVVFERSNVTDADLKHFENQNWIFLASLANCPGITDDGVRSIAKIPHITKLDLAGTKVTDAGLEALRDCPELNRLYLDETEIGDQGIKNLNPTPRLIALHLVACPNITAESLKFIAATWPNLSFIEIGGVDSIKSEDLEYLRPLKKLIYLNIVGIAVTDKVVEMLGSKAKLRELYFTKGRFSSKSLKHLYGLKLMNLSLIGCKNLTREAVTELKEHLPPSCSLICPIHEDNSQLTDQLREMYGTESKAIEGALGRRLLEIGPQTP